MVCREAAEETISWRSKAGWTRGSYYKEIESEMENAGKSCGKVGWWTYAKDTTILNVALDFSCATRDRGDTTGSGSGRHFVGGC